ncbi:hypothetical protein [Variovorax sp.]|uniref:hypothetical protein n=1 Tax=Variovorax sp. TaxID=1871043 RepID=UPI0013806B8F|nr:hypothetical protein [Variovorax sp.]KAF1061440.1 MAG: hypothetical protein GAK39_05678 [Variovorax sp.]
MSVNQGQDQNVVGEAAAELTRQQVQQALAIAGASDFSGSTDPAFVGSVLVALAINTSSVSATIDNAKTRRDATGGGGLTEH